ncbi:AQJ64_40280 family protein [Nocardiopsis synnemataformans]|uniref:AQJ64_40280 family protein n=1 Tax=Nocardiopsis synnemataformans TaxID=61305 RepID=UPI003EB7FAA8
MARKAEVDWVSVEEGLPHDGAAVLGAVTGRYPDGEEFWLVLPMHFRRTHPDESTGEEIRDVFVDSDWVLRKPHGGDTEEQVTHWAEYPCLPGTAVRQIVGGQVRDALAATGQD